jgi:arabinogalactan endo-1,4-beta-galactosidase
VEFGIAGVATRPLTPTSEYKAPDRVDPAIGQMSSMQLVAMGEAERIAWSKAHLWPYTGRLIAATAEGIRSVAPGAKVSSHISPIGQKTPAVTLAFWETVKSAGFLPDQFGASYYPGLGKSRGGPEDAFAWFKEVATTLKRRYGRPVFIAEGGVASGHMPPPFSFNDPVPGYPLSLEGQAAFNRDLVAWGVQSGALAGYRPWAPDLCVGPGWEPMAWFDAKGRAKPVLNTFETALRRR